MVTIRFMCDRGLTLPQLEYCPCFYSSYSLKAEGMSGKGGERQVPLRAAKGRKPTTGKQQVFLTGVRPELTLRGTGLRRLTRQKQH